MLRYLPNWRLIVVAIVSIGLWAILIDCLYLLMNIVLGEL